MNRHEFLTRAQLQPETLQAFITAGWLLPHGERRELDELDLARAQLIRDLKGDFGVNDAGIPIVLHLLDQLHGVRRLLRDMLETPPAHERWHGLQ
jgi:chaperone modulatory protein CbpM